MAEENEGASKTEEPTPRKLEQARSQGDVARTPDLSSVFALAGAASVLAIAGGMFCRNIAAQLLPFIAHPDAIPVTGHDGVEIARYCGKVAAPIILAVLLTAGLGGAAGGLVQTGLLFTPSKLAPDWKKVSPMSGFARLFGIDGVIQFVKSLLKVAATAAVAWYVLKPHLVELQNLANVDPLSILPFVADILRRMVIAIGGLMLVIAGADWMVQKQRFMSRMRMTKEEIKEDYKQSEGDPHVKAKQKQLRAERARRRMMANVPKATVVIMNPTHYAVALKYVQGEDDAPECVAKGLDSLALKIRAIAEENGVPVIEDPPLARALYAAVDVEETIPPAHYQAVAKVIGFILNAAKKPKAKHL
jgi:flagellar biosynthetic protein FlhB